MSLPLFEMIMKWKKVFLVKFLAIWNRNSSVEWFLVVENMKIPINSFEYFKKNRLLNVVQFWIDQVVWFFKNKSWKMLPRSQQFNLVTRTPVPIKPRNKKIIQFVFYNKKSDRYLRQRKSSPKSIPIFSLLEGFLIK